MAQTPQKTISDFSREAEESGSSSVSAFFPIYAEGSAPQGQLVLTTASKDKNITALVDAWLMEALAARASDAHFVPEEDMLKVQFRIDGVLNMVHRLEKNLWPQICNRIKVMGDMDIAQTRKPQDGRFHLEWEGSRVDCRLSSHPIRLGESLVVRFLPQDRQGLTLETLGFSPGQIEQLKRLAQMPEGLLLVVGPTGSGKTTTLYALLSHVNHAGVNIMTLEDPIEYHLDHIRQTQVGETLTFGQGIRSMLRQDPDVMLIGEVRDGETALMAIQAALTGHKIFTTLHTSDAAQAIYRLEDLGVSREKLTYTTSAIISQRLLRQLCTFCKEPDSAAQEATFQAVGCERCQGSGYHGRFPIAQILEMTPSLRQAIVERRPIEGAGFPEQTLWEAGLVHVRAGKTSLEELKRVVCEGAMG